MNQRRPNQEGFTLLELLISIAILATGLLALASTLVSASHARVNDVARSQVLNMAENVMEEIRSQVPAELKTSYHGQSYDVGAIPGSNSAVGTVQVSIDDTEPTLIEINITGAWNVNGATGAVVLSSTMRNL